MDKNEFIKYLNDIISKCEPINYEDWNRSWQFKKDVDLDSIDMVVSSKNNQITTISFIASITEKLCDSRLGFQLEDGIIKGVGWYE